MAMGWWPRRRGRSVGLGLWWRMNHHGCHVHTIIYWWHRHVLHLWCRWRRLLLRLCGLHIWTGLYWWLCTALARCLVGPISRCLLQSLNADYGNATADIQQRSTCESRQIDPLLKSMTRAADVKKLICRSLSLSRQIFWGGVPIIQHEFVAWLDTRPTRSVTLCSTIWRIQQARGNLEKKLLLWLDKSSVAKFQIIPDRFFNLPSKSRFSTWRNVCKEGCFGNYRGSSGDGGGCGAAWPKGEEREREHVQKFLWGSFNVPYFALLFTWVMQWDSNQWSRGRRLSDFLVTGH